MRKTLLSLIAFFTVMSTFAQTTITNGNMEAWQNVGQNTEEPTQWNSIKTGAGNSTALTFAPQSCFRESNNPHSGTYCARIVTGSALGQAAPGSLTTGRVMVPTLSASEGYIRTIPGDPNFSMPFTGRPDSLVVWYRYTKQGSDYPSISALLHVGYAYLPEVPVNNNHPDSTVNIIARAEWQGPSASVTTWTRIAIPFVYVDNRTPQYILITLTSSANSNATSNTTIYVDDFEVIYNPTIATGTIAPTTYYVSAASGATVSVPFTLTGNFNGNNTVTAQLSDASGSFASPVTIGSVSATASGSITATIPAGTAAGTAYRIRVVSSNPALTAADNGNNLTIINVSNSIAPSAAQTIAANANGSTLTVTETAGVVSKEWKYSTVSGSGYVSFNPIQTGNTYTPNFATAGTYYVVCVSTYPGSVNVTSNEVQVNVVSNSIAPTAPQSILVSTPGIVLTVTETPAGSSREWEFSTTQGGPYSAFNPMQMGTTYTPNFAASGVYYVVCKSIINGVQVTSNEVQISVNSVTLATGTISGSPFEFSANAPDATVNVPFTTSGSFNGGNVFTAQLSDANGSFASATNIGTLNATSSGTVSATIPANTPAGTGYRIRVVASNPSVFGTDNGSDLTVDQFNNSVSPTATQTIMYNTSGSAISVTASQNATHEWKYSGTSGSGYVSFNPAETGAAYTPNFALPGTYFVVCVSTNQYNDEVTSNEVQIDVQNGTSITTSAVSGSPYLVSPSANVQVSVNFTSDVVFNAGNVFKAQLSDATGSFASPVEIGTLSGATVGAIAAVIPNNTPDGSGYRIRVVSTDPAVTGSDNGSNLTVVPFSLSIAPSNTQTIVKNQAGSPITVTGTHPCTYLWQYSDVSGFGFNNFNPSQTNDTYTPQFATVGTWYVRCKLTNTVSDEIISQEVVIIVEDAVSVGDVANGNIKAYWSGNNFVVDMTHSLVTNATLEIVNVSGQVAVKEKLNDASLNSIATALPEGMYVFRIVSGTKVWSGKTNKR
ncbi:MAG: PCMD domain-containing protein [Chitinophagales bacterium]|nr:PCMD domain-containing protein [Chitinophagales bacterium]